MKVIIAALTAVSVIAGATRSCQRRAIEPSDQRQGYEVKTAVRKEIQEETLPAVLGYQCYRPAV